MAKPGWYNDRENAEIARWFDGENWTEHVVRKADWQGRPAPPPVAGLVLPADLDAAGSVERDQSRGGRRPAARRSMLAALVAAAVLSGALVSVRLLGGNSNENGVVSVSSSRTSSATSNQASVQIPRGSVAGDGELRLARAAIPSALPPSVAPVGEALTVTLTGTTLLGEATIEFHPRPFDPHGLYVVVWQDPEGGWRWLPTTVDVARRTVAATTNHFSIGFLAKINVPRWAKERAEAIKNVVTSRSGVTQPRCGDENALRNAGVTVSSDSGDSVKWCSGLENKRNILRIANNRRTYTQITYPASWSLIDSGKLGVSVDALVRSTSGWLDGVSAPRGMTVREVSGGDTITLAMPANPSAAVVAEPSVTAWFLEAINLGFEVWSGVGGAAKSELGERGSTAFSRLIADVATADPNKGWSKALAACTKAAGGLTGDSLDVSTSKALLKFAWDCIPRMVAADVGQSGIAFWGLGVVLSAVGAAVGAVLTAAHLILTGIREIWDSVASLGGNSSSIYNIRIRSRMALSTPIACGDLTFTSQTEDGASDILVTGLSCELAADFIRRVARSHNFYSGPRSFTYEGFSCTEKLVDNGLPAGLYRCVDGERTVSWKKT